MDRLRDKVAVVTGAGSGIGKAIAAGMVGEGATVARLDIDAAEAELIACDVADEASVGHAIDAVLSRHGHIDVLVNAAGIWRGGSVVEANVDAWDATMTVNLRGPFLVSRAVIPAMIGTGGGSIVHIGSTSGLVGDTGNAPYSASKGGVIALTRSMALDHAGHGVRVNCICPGITRTPMLDATERELTQAQAERLNERRLAGIPMGRLGSTDDLVPAAIYLASDEASWVTGTNLTVDGGYLAGMIMREPQERKE